MQLLFLAVQYKINISEFSFSVGQRSERLVAGGPDARKFEKEISDINKTIKELESKSVSFDRMLNNTHFNASCLARNMHVNGLIAGTLCAFSVTGSSSKLLGSLYCFDFFIANLFAPVGGKGSF